MQHPETVTVMKDGKQYTVNKEDYERTPDHYGEIVDLVTTSKGKGETIKRDDVNVEPPPMLAGNPLNPVGQPEGQVPSPTVVQKGEKYFVVGDDGEVDSRFEKKGYKTDVEAWTEVARITDQASKAI